MCECRFLMFRERMTLRAYWKYNQKRETNLLDRRGLNVFDQQYVECRSLDIELEAAQLDV